MSKDYGQPAPDEAIKNTLQALEANGFTVEVVDNIQAARERVLALIPEGSEVFNATSVTLTKAGLDKDFNESGKYVSARAKYSPLYGQPEKAIEMRQLSSASDYAVGSVHAITEDGHVMVVSNTGSQLPNYVYGANHVIWVVGSQKIVKDMHEALDRLDTHVFPLENERANQAYGNDTLVSKILFYRQDPVKRVTIILVKEAVGF